MSNLQRQLIKMVESMPAFPNSVHRILQLTSDINCSAKELVEVIDHDPIMTMKMLKMVNSPYFGFSRKVAAINHAVVYIGVNTIKNLAVSIATLGVLPRTNKAGMNMIKFLLHSLGTATVARLIGKRLGATDMICNDHFVAGLLHDFGKAVFAHYMPVEYLGVLAAAESRSCSLHQVEQELIGADHCQLGSMLGEKWQLPAMLVQSISDHHHPTPDSPDQTFAVFVANQITKQLRFGFSGHRVVEELPDFIVARFGMDLAEWINTMGDLPSEMNKARVFTHL